jgi:hypothetical protein
MFEVQQRRPDLQRRDAETPDTALLFVPVSGSSIDSKPLSKEAETVTRTPDQRLNYCHVVKAAARKCKDPDRLGEIIVAELVFDQRRRLRPHEYMTEREINTLRRTTIRETK